MSANPERGEISVETKDGKSYTLRPSLQAMCVVQNKLKKKFGVIEGDALTGDAECLRAMLWTYLQARHKAECETVEQAAALVDEIGVFVVTQALGELMELNKPSEKPSQGGAARPSNAQTPTGGTSSSEPEASV